MPELIFHHYPVSPFAEKIRAIFGFKKLAWRSVIIPLVMPKPNLTALTGGYRRTPVLQVGADIYCDTALIADVLERMAPTPTLYPAPVADLARTLAQWADSTLFWTVIAYVYQPAGIAGILGALPPEQMKCFAADRAAMRGNTPRMAVADATGYLDQYLRRLESMLADGKPYLLGGQPSIADFSVYHCLWLLKLAPALTGILEHAPQLQAWIARMAGFGHHQFEQMGEAQALKTAQLATAADSGHLPFVGTHGAALGERMAVVPADYALDPVEGELVICSETEFAVRRADPQAGSVVVHFPRLGFQLKKLEETA